MQVSSALKSFLDVLIPNGCPICEKIVSAANTVCEECWPQLSFITEPCCVLCGVPFESEYPDVRICYECNEWPPEFHMARAPLVYNDAARELVTAFKYEDRTHLAPFFRKVLKLSVSSLGSIDYVVPVPLHYARLLERRYNQSAMLARIAAEIGSGKVLYEGLLRNRNTSKQHGLSRKERRENVRDAFAVNSKSATQIKGKNILLVDDVLTTGATANECAKVLKEKGARVVKVLSLARTPLN